MSAAVTAATAAAAAALSRRRSSTNSNKSSSEGFYGQYYPFLSLQQKSVRSPPLISRYENLKQQDWIKFRQFLKTRFPKLPLAGIDGSTVVDFLSYIDGFGETKVHAAACSNFGTRYPTSPSCDCPTRQPWTSLVALIGRLRVAFEENGGNPATNPFNAVDVKVYLNDAKDSQNRSRGIDR